MVAIIAVLISILIPSLAAARAQARQAVCGSNLRQLAVGFLTYASQWNGHLPGGSYDFEGVADRYNSGPTYDWLGTRRFTGNDEKHVPSAGTIFKYVGQQREIYKCPSDKLTEIAERADTSELREKTLYSYTAPAILPGAPIALLKRTIWPANFGNRPNPGWRKFGISSEPWMLVEEHEAYNLNYSVDSTWAMSDSISDRHAGRGAVAHIDGHVKHRAYQQKPNRVRAELVIFELIDGRTLPVVDSDPKGGTYHGVYMGDIRKPGYLFER